ncbi:uncharacterized protein J7T54_002117 [Emericellopsis cladophorae]|uniref:Rhomboid family membrane protein n=1 Tax=Emericellopsis cladophorae TaxID=2686198 RepID=A0A9Q0BEI4_9HYPO|nr:uncharacterized protein J7T54_002117 [Emericellopsis cladophorae]KAI6782957.1 hypothetical protein J7T54_002117 [Emericellopsis cladophorae]
MPVVDHPLPPSEGTEKFLKNAAIAGAIICPAAMLLPPRKVDLRFFILFTGFSLSTNHLASVYTGESFYGRFQRRANAMTDSMSGLPKEARETQRILREHKEQLAREKGEAAAAAAAAAQEHKDGGIRKVVEDVWMGGEGKDWQKKRLEEHEQKLAEGKGMTGIIMDQIAEVWSGNWRPDSGKKEGSENDNKSEGKK